MSRAVMKIGKNVEEIDARYMKLKSFEYFNMWKK